ncbi:MAG: hypothetical protein EAX95_04695 [Candidatus Thorarchaeota archaeon]|nr:hypothetical protein [Candidatus Thorarchaeota archaeon]
MTKAYVMDDLPDEVFVALGRRGMEGIPLKECTYDCDGKELALLKVDKKPQEITGGGQETALEDWQVQCMKCQRTFTIRCKIRYFDGKRFDTMVSILDDKGNDLGWLGSF